MDGNLGATSSNKESVRGGVIDLESWDASRMQTVAWLKWASSSAPPSLSKFYVRTASGTLKWEL